jgi:hypothetical protein
LRARFPWWLALILVLGLVLTLIFGLRVFRSFRKMPRNGPPPAVMTDVSLIRGWMTIEYVSRAYSVPEPVLVDGLQLSRADSDRRTLAQIAAERNPDDPEQLIADVGALILEFQARYPHGLPTLEPKPGIPPPPKLRP